MLRKIVSINSISTVQQNVGQNIYGLQEIQYEETSVGKGAVGSVFKVINIDGKTEHGLLLKIISEAEFIQKSYETISILHDKLNKHQINTGIPVFIEVPELNGLPFIAFKGKIEGVEEEIAGYLMRDLIYYDYNDFGAEEWDKQRYITEIGFEEKLYLCYQFTRGVNFLHEQNFIHSDLKEYSIFINLERPQLSIIDYDGGYHYDKQDFALTIGAITAWASAGWRKLISQGKSAKDVSAKERLDEESWVLASGLFELLFGITPFYFLKSIDDEAINNYLKSNSWPNISKSSNEINEQNIVFHKNLVKIIEDLSSQGLKPIIDAFKKVFNKGHDNLKARLTPKQWKNILFEVNSKLVGNPKIISFSSNKNSINYKGEKVEFNWEAKFYRAIFIDNVLQNPLSNSTEIILDDSTEILIRVVNDFGESIEKLQIDANKVVPVVEKFETNTPKRIDLSPVILSWETSNCRNVSIENFANLFPSIGSNEVNPLEKTKYKLTAIGYFDQKVTSEIEIDVECAKINSFRYEINIDKGIDNIDLFWETDNANHVEILPKIGKVYPSGSTNIGINDKTKFTLKVKGYFNEVEKSIEAQPFPIPIIKGIFVPTPVVFIETKVPEQLLQIPGFLSDTLKVNFNNSISYNEVKPPFVEFDENKITKQLIIKEDSKPYSILSLFDNLFKRTHNK